jgi:hypothetical protein
MNIENKGKVVNTTILSLGLKEHRNQGRLDKYEGMSSDSNIY